MLLASMIAAAIGQESEPAYRTYPPVRAGWPLTRAERTRFKETSLYADVVEFLDDLQAKGARFGVQFIGTSAGGKRIPLVIVSDPPVGNAPEARRFGKPVVYIQANIHAGEVEGKESIQMLLRDLLIEEKGKLLEKLVLLITPIYNIDGNEKLGANERNRGHQDGPPMVGERANGQGLDLNRDCIKAESPEMRAVLEHVYVPWDPDVVMDLHTTNGTRHGYPLTYSPALNPNTDPGVLRWNRDLLSKLRSRLRREQGLETFDYGNAETAGGATSWRTFGHEARYVTNYGGIRNRVSVLSEAASFYPFEDRVLSTYAFVRAVLNEVAANSKTVLRLSKAADDRMRAMAERVTDPIELGVRFEFDQRRAEPVVVEDLAAGESPNVRAVPKKLKSRQMPVFDRFKNARTAPFPAAYVLPNQYGGCVQLMRRHGIVVEKLRTAWTPRAGSTRAFTVSELKASHTQFQNHRLVTLEGKFGNGPDRFPVGSYVVRTSQPLGALVFHLCEPESTDGLAAWNFLDEGLGVGKQFPIVKVFAQPDASLERVP